MGRAMHAVNRTTNTAAWPLDTSVVSLKSLGGILTLLFRRNKMTYQRIDIRVPARVGAGELTPEEIAEVISSFTAPELPVQNGSVTSKDSMERNNDEKLQGTTAKTGSA